MKDSSSLLGDTLRSALESALDPALAAADWLARDIDPAVHCAADLLASPRTPLAQLTQAKEAFKTMRIVGETPADRAMGARLYAAAIAAAFVHHGKRISRQSHTALLKALNMLHDDQAARRELRDLAGLALSRLTAPPTVPAAQPLPAAPSLPPPPAAPA